MKKPPKDPTRNLYYVRMFRLVRRVTHRPHPKELPDQAKLNAAAGKAVAKACNVLLGLSK